MKSKKNVIFYGWCARKYLGICSYEIRKEQAVLNSVLAFKRDFSMNRMKARRTALSGVKLEFFL